MTRKTTHVVPNHERDGWDVVQGGAERASKHFERKEDAVHWGRELSRREHSEFIIHDKHGVIREADSHGHDPDPPKDKD